MSDKMKAHGMITCFSLSWLRVKCKKTHACYYCDESIEVGDETFRPLREDEFVTRGDRLCMACGEKYGT